MKRTIEVIECDMCKGHRSAVRTVLFTDTRELDLCNQHLSTLLTASHPRRVEPSHVTDDEIACPHCDRTFGSGQAVSMHITRSHPELRVA